VQLSAHYSGNHELRKVLPQLPERMHAALEQDWQPAIDALQDAVNLIVLGRGLCFPVTQEAALKFKETANIHAESFSSAEFQHGPMALAQPNFPLLAFAQQGPALPSTLALMTKMKNLGSKTILAAASNIDTLNAADILLPLPESLHPACDPLVGIQAFYPMMAQLAVNRGYNPDAPDNLQKVTETQ
jgi:glucosamine--fructose-6-phosphate aminotransferase (isomerizing)